MTGLYNMVRLIPNFTVCKPTYIGAQMPGLDYEHTQAIVLER